MHPARPVFALDPGQCLEFAQVVLIGRNAVLQSSFIAWRQVIGCLVQVRHWLQGRAGLARLPVAPVA
ncbi:conserved protein of unknown function [Rhodovastum atsumiense]|uniref:Uncharacterized protein n=1 Tax=Rhodovastum atsumiense TaxID=504468 RepID=A0A5M6IYM5_9PROT|nr:hypothetical protein [Rhodovastum atsumiense]KAA5613381.1 hypothetical protein F1189_04790 [Rhodovastum atsumiense]CAH2603062.1 conserved protein of unknown function [Rhodovastum atsumiense]